MCKAHRFRDESKGETVDIAETPRKENRAKQALKKAFVELYAQTSVEKITASQLSRQAGYSRVTFYAYFDDVYQVLEEVENDVLAALGSLYDFSDGRLTAEVVRSGELPPCAVEWFKKCRSHRTFLLAVLGEHGDASFQYKMKNILRAGLKRISLMDAVPDDRRTSFVIEYQISGIIGILELYLKKTDQATDREVADVVNTLRRHWVAYRKRAGEGEG